MSSPRLIFFALFAVLFALARPLESRAQIYADVTVAGAATGTFTIILEHQKAPGAVANFIGLATGRRGWLDGLTGAIRSDGFYNGVSFHRVIAGFMSQTGSRAGDGTDGPGYTFRNEIDAALTHNAAYVVAMANSGKDTNGSQFYITAAAQPGLDGGYTVFGRVVAGTAVCDSMNATPTTGASGSPADRPLTAITITGVTIYGPSYAAFNLAQPLLPTLAGAAPLLKKAGASYTLGFDRRTYSDYFGFHSGDFATWNKFTSGYYSGVAQTAVDLDVSSFATGTRRFFRLGRADYSTCANLFVPANLAGKSLHFSNPLGGTLVVNASGNGGTWFFDGGGSTGVVSYNSFPQPYSGYLFIQWENGVQISFDRLEYSSATGGAFAGRTNVTGFSTISGSFTSTP